MNKKYNNQLILNPNVNKINDIHNYMLCIYSITMYQYQMIILNAIRLLCNNKHKINTSDFGYLYIIMIFGIYWLRLFILFMHRLSIVNKKQADILKNKINKLIIIFQFNNNKIKMMKNTSN